MKRLFNPRIMPVFLAGAAAGAAAVLVFEAAGLHAAFCIIPAVAAVLCALFNKKTAAAVCLCLLAGAAAGTVRAYAEINSIEERAFYAENIEVSARIEFGNGDMTDGTVLKSGAIVDDIVADGTPLEGKGYLVSGQIGSGDFREGDVISFVADVTTQASGVTDSYSAARLAEGTIFVIRVRDGEDFPIVKTGERAGFFDKIRIKTGETLARSVREDTGAFMYAMLFGQAGTVDDDVRGDFSASGTAHLLAVSGLHVGMLCSSLMFILRKLRFGRKLSFAAVAAVLAGFSALCGFSASVVRASLMASVYALTPVLGTRYDKLSSLSFAAIVLIAVSPYNLFSIGFLMSFSSVFGLILFCKPITDACVRRRIPSCIASGFGVTVAANIGLLPLMLFTFGKVSSVIVVANMIVVPVIAVAFPLFLAALAVAFIPVFGFVLSLISLFFTAVSAAVRAFAAIPAPGIYLEVSWYGIAVYYCLLFAVSEFSFAPSAAKKFTAAVMVLIFAASFAAQNVYKWLYADKAVCFVSGSAAGAVFITSSGNAYAAVSGAFDKETADILAGIAEEYDIREYDAFIKKELGSEERKLLRDYGSPLNVKRICSLFPDMIGGIPPEDSLLKEGFGAYFSQKGIVCLIEDASVFISYDFPYGDPGATDADLLVCPEADGPLREGQTAASDKAYSATGENSVPSDFTFGVKGGRIKKTVKWRFV